LVRYRELLDGQLTKFQGLIPPNGVWGFMSVGQA